MTKSPAFLFYPGDWLGGTLGMTLEEKGAYMELLILQFNRGHMTSHMIGQVIGQNWVNIKCKFSIDSDGLFYNKRLDIEKEKRKMYVESRNNNRSGENQHTKKIKKQAHKTKDIKGHMTSHMENENENENINEYGIENKNQLAKIKNFQIPEISELVEYFELRHSSEIEAAKFYNFYQSKNWMVGKSKMKDWRAAANGWVLRNKTDFKNGGQKLDRTDQNKMTTIAALHKLNQKIESNEV